MTSNIEDPRIADLKRIKKQLEETDRSTTQNLSGELTEEQKLANQKHIEYMRENGHPYFPYTHSESDCPWCKKMQNTYVDQLLHGFKLVMKDKETHEIIGTLIGPTVEGCEACGRKVMISKEGIKAKW